MCDYSLHHVASRPAKVSDKLVTMELTGSSARGFAAVGELGTVLQLPVATQHHAETRLVRSAVSCLRLDRVSRRPGIASVLVPNQGAVMLWETLRSMATTLSTAFAQSFRRLKTHNPHPILEDGLPSIDGKKIDTSLTDLLTVTLANKLGAHKPEKKIEVNAAA